MKNNNRKAYPKYKPSGVEWLGDVPEHWDVKRARYMLSMNPSKQEIYYLDPETEIAFLPMEAVGEDGSLRLDTKRPIFEVSSGYTFFAEGDVTYAKITPCFENGKGAIMRDLGTGYGFGTTELTVIRPGQCLNREYLYYVTISNDFRKNGEAWMYGAGGQKRVPDDFVKEFRIGFPPLPEQQAIADFLDRETGRIDVLIEKKQRLLKLLAEQRTAMISAAVTGKMTVPVSTGTRTGTGKMKPSGVEWLGDVPVHWDVKKIRNIFTFRSGGTPSTENVEYWDGSIPWVSSKDMKSFYIEDTEDHINEIAVQESATNLIPVHTLVVVMRSGILIHSIPACVLMSEMAINQDIKAFLPLLKVSAVFYARFIQGFQKQLLTEWRKEGATVESLDMELIKNFQIILPPLPEQQAIAAFLDRETARIDTLSAKVTTVIERLKEYRTALISSAVTGKIDVSTEFTLSNVEGLNTSVREGV